MLPNSLHSVSISQYRYTTVAHEKIHQFISIMEWNHHIYNHYYPGTTSICTRCRTAGGRGTAFRKGRQVTVKIFVSLEVAHVFGL